MKIVNPLSKWFVAFGVVGALWLSVSPGRGQQPQGAKAEEAPAAKNPRAQLDQILDLQKQIAEAMRANDPQKTLALVTNLQKLMVADLGDGNVRMQIFPLSGGREQPKSDLRQQYDKQLKEFADSIDKLKDDKEAREAIEKARDEYKKAMKAELHKDDKARPAPRSLPAFPRNELVPFPAFEFGPRNFGLGGAQLRLGVAFEKPSEVLMEQLDLPANVGLVVLEVKHDSAAEKAGLKKNDILLQWAGKDIPSELEKFQASVAEAKVGEKIDAVVMRKGKKETIKGIELPEAKRGGALFN